MITVLRSGGFELAIYAFDHPPPHVHVYGDGVAKILLHGRRGTVELVYAIRMRNGELRKALSVVREHQAELLAEWERIHG